MRIKQSPHAAIQSVQILLPDFPYPLDGGKIINLLSVPQHLAEQRLNIRNLLGGEVSVRLVLAGRASWY